MSTALDHRDGPRDECGVFGIYAPEHGGRAPDLLRALRAPASRPGIGRDRGRAARRLDPGDPRAGPRLAGLRRAHAALAVGDLAIGHVRYSTTGSSEWENAQPIVRDDNRTLALAHNGNLINAVELHTELRGRDVPFRSTSDSEIIAALLATHPADTIEEAVADVLPQLQGAFSTVVMTDDRVVAFRDPHGLRPLALGVIADDDEQRPSRLLRRQRVLRVRPDRRRASCVRSSPARSSRSTPTGVRSQVVAGGERHAFCVFEYIYFARPDSLMGGQRLQVSRAQDGRDPVARGAGRRRPRDRDPGLRQRRRARSRARRRASRRTTASSRTATSRAPSSSPASSCAATACG